MGATSSSNQSTRKHRKAAAPADHDGLAGLRQIRDEIRLHMHLASMDVKKRFGALEGEYEKVEGAAHEASESVRKLSDALMHGFRELKASLTQPRD